MINLPEEILLTDDSVIDSSKCSICLEDGFYWINTEVGRFPIFELEGIFYSGVSNVTSIDNSEEPVFLSDETLNLIRLSGKG